MMRFIAFAVALAFSTGALAFDQTHSAWDALLKKHVVLVDAANASRVDYRGFKQDHAALEDYLKALSAVSASDFARFDKPQQMAFLINAYNAFTIQLILSRYPQLHSIKDLGGFLSSPWSQKFFDLLGEHSSLDQVEAYLRTPGRYDDPRIHFAINCASIGCPMLRNETYVADRLDAQLDDAMRHFLSDRKRNRLDAAEGRLEVSKIFDWYGKDFSTGYHGFSSVLQTLGRFADALADSPKDRDRIRLGQVPIGFLDYDWGLNDVAH